MRNVFNPKAAVITILILHGIAGAVYGIGAFLRWQALSITHWVYPDCRHTTNDHANAIISIVGMEVVLVVGGLFFGILSRELVKAIYGKVDSWFEERRYRRSA